MICNFRQIDAEYLRKFEELIQVEPGTNSSA